MRIGLRVAVVLIVSTVALGGCMQPAQRPALEQGKALQLIDQGTTQLRRGELEKAQASYQMAYDLAKLPQGLDGLGCVALLRGEYKLAEDYFKTAMEQDPTYQTPLANLALLYDLSGRSKEAKLFYRRAIDAQPLNARVRSNFGAFIADTEEGREFEAEREMLHAQALSDSPLIETNLRRLARKRDADL
ncbi:MAG: hypothetical protein EBZ48_07610 [Proteobacteria bacterium]|nr:hypothetical protein [Pseudomonadota bacterium]